eukprot:Rhum_TRINITY_DN13296_c1_g1::Rhum_TRINITY_DN13296_c1_g1_i1::g.57913::m.57913
MSVEATVATCCASLLTQTCITSHPSSPSSFLMRASVQPNTREWPSTVPATRESPSHRYSRSFVDSTSGPSCIVATHSPVRTSICRIARSKLRSFRREMAGSAGSDEVLEKDELTESVRPRPIATDARMPSLLTATATTGLWYPRRYLRLPLRYFLGTSRLASSSNGRVAAAAASPSSSVSANGAPNGVATSLRPRPAAVSAAASGAAERHTVVAPAAMRWKVAGATAMASCGVTCSAGARAAAKAQVLAPEPTGLRPTASAVGKPETAPRLVASPLDSQRSRRLRLERRGIVFRSTSNRSSPALRTRGSGGGGDGCVAAAGGDSGAGGGGGCGCRGARMRGDGRPSEALLTSWTQLCVAAAEHAVGTEVVIRCTERVDALQPISAGLREGRSAYPSRVRPKPSAGASAFLHSVAHNALYRASLCSKKSCINKRQTRKSNYYVGCNEVQIL